MFIITIEHETTQEQKEQLHTVLEERPLTKEEHRDSWISEHDKDTPMKKVYGYAPERTVTRLVKRKIYERSIPVTNIVDIIKAIEGIK